MPSAFRRTASASAVLALGLGSLLSFAAPASAAQSTGVPVAKPGVAGVVDIFNINDFHGRIDTDYTGKLGTSFACTLEGAKAKYGEANSLFVAAGDNIGASPFTSSSQDDDPTIDYLNALQLQATAAGNHEFDKGWPDLRDRVVPRADYKILGANVTDGGAPALEAYRVVEVNGLKVGIIGAVTSETPSLTGPGTEMLTFSDPVVAVNKVADQLTDGDPANGEADVLIAEYHEGASEGTPDGATVEEEIAAGGIFASIVNKTSPKVSAIFTGHTHKEYAWDAPMPGGNGTRPILQTSSYAAYLGHAQLTFDVETKALTSYAIQNIAVPTAPAADCPTDDPEYKAAKQIVDAAVLKAKEIGQQSIGSVTADITTAYSGGKRDDRSSESTLSNLLAQSMVDVLNEPGRSGAQIGVMNPGGVRSELLYNDGTNASGDVTYGEASAVVPFANTLQTIELTGAQFKAVLEQQWQPAGSSRPYLKLGLSQNVTYTFDPDRAEGDRITSIMVDDGPIDPAATYTVVGASFLVGGGDNFTAFRQGANVKDSGLIDTESFINWVKASSPLAPSFAKHAVVVRDVPTSVVAGQALNFQAQGFDLTSLGSPTNTGGSVLLNGVEIGTFTIVDGTIVESPVPNVAGKGGVATIDSVIPYSTAAGPALLQLVAAPTASARPSSARIAAAAAAPDGPTTVSIPITVTAPTPTITIDSPVQAGGSTNVTVSGFPAGATVDIAIDGEVITQVTVGDDGTYSGVLVVPQGVVGVHTLTATSGDLTASAEFEVVSGETPPSPGSPTSPAPGASPTQPPTASGKRPQIAYTGTDAGPQLVLAGILLAAGAAFTLTGRRRQA